MKRKSRVGSQSQESWSDVLAQVVKCLKRLEKNGCPDPYFRGHSNSNWHLQPVLSRVRVEWDIEDRFYYRFRQMGSHLFSADSTPWDILFLMRHHGIPTRLLDWTESFAIALEFAVKSASGDCAVWILDPYQLNKQSYGTDSVPNLNGDFPRGYEAYFLRSAEKKGRFPADVLAVEGSSRVARMQSQRSAFTLHRNLKIHIEKKYAHALTKIVIPQSALAEAREFLILTGINDFSIFPDLDGLGRYLVETETKSSIFK